MNHQDLTPFQAGNLCDCVCGAKHADSRPRGEKCPARCDHFPKLSTTGKGMLTLMDALRTQGHSWVVEGDGYGLCRGKVQPEGWHHAILGERTDSAPLALALAAAASLGIEVPE